MTPEQENALRATARRCNDEIKGLGVPFLLFVYTIGRINGQFREH